MEFGRVIATGTARDRARIVMKRMDTGSVWPVSNNPAARYWEPRPVPNSNRARRGNKDYKLWELIRSSTAAPHYFSDKRIEIFDGLDDGTGQGSFIDGAVSPHNSPALKMFMMAGIKGYNLGGGGVAGMAVAKPGISAQTSSCWSRLAPGSTPRRREPRELPPTMPCFRYKA